MCLRIIIIVSFLPSYLCLRSSLLHVCCVHKHTNTVNISTYIFSLSLSLSHSLSLALSLLENLFLRFLLLCVYSYRWLEDTIDMKLSRLLLTIWCSVLVEHLTELDVQSINGSSNLTKSNQFRSKHSRNFNITVHVAHILRTHSVS